jgi:hypothetical protein
MLDSADLERVKEQSYKDLFKERARSAIIFSSIAMIVIFFVGQAMNTQSSSWVYLVSYAYLTIYQIFKPKWIAHMRNFLGIDKTK